MQRPEDGQPPQNIFRVVHPPPNPAETAYALLHPQHVTAARAPYGLVHSQQLPTAQIAFGGGHQLQVPAPQPQYARVQQQTQPAAPQTSYGLAQHGNVPAPQPTYSLAHLAQQHVPQQPYGMPHHVHMQPAQPAYAAQQHAQQQRVAQPAAAQQPYGLVHTPQTRPQPTQPVAAAAAAPVAAAQPEPEPKPAAELRGSDKDFGLLLPLARVRRIIKADSEVKAVSMEASYAVARATELLLEEMVKRTVDTMNKENRRSLLYNDVADIVHEWPALGFLKDIVPNKVPASVLIEQLRQQQAQQAQREQQENKLELERQRQQLVQQEAAGPSNEPSTANGYDDEGGDDEEMPDGSGQHDY